MDGRTIQLLLDNNFFIAIKIATPVPVCLRCLIFRLSLATLRFSKTRLMDDLNSSIQ